MTSDTSEHGLESLIVKHMTSSGWVAGQPSDYDRAYAVDLVQLSAFIKATQEPFLEAFELNSDNPTRRKFLARLQGEITKRGTIDVLRHGIKHGPYHVGLFYGTLTHVQQHGAGQRYLIQHSAGSGKSR